MACFAGLCEAWGRVLCTWAVLETSRTEVTPAVKMDTELAWHLGLKSSGEVPFVPLPFSALQPQCRLVPDQWDLHLICVLSFANGTDLPAEGPMDGVSVWADSSKPPPRLGTTCCCGNCKSKSALAELLPEAPMA
eukprot:CAMPEP_0172730698 /NCGR_PEP_ID=MMETSP1074-20121228/98901_1 /TAXON_ID=2916 /ORGANISM="Ceratium fusus, Strain PA161109" /LENGTH=134 /DNA_ID=CAMNT_0013558513 /DNA_START=504 /DNA_END=905 /DNA_ORIENTATION=+